MKSIKENRSPLDAEESVPRPARVLQLLYQHLQGGISAFELTEWPLRKCSSPFGTVNQRAPPRFDELKNGKLKCRIGTLSSGFKGTREDLANFKCERRSFFFLPSSVGTLEQFIRSEDYVLRIVGCDYFTAHFALPADGENTTSCIYALKFCFRKRIFICHLLQLSFKSLGRGITLKFGWNVWSEISGKKTERVFYFMSWCIFKNTVEVNLYRHKAAC